MSTLIETLATHQLEIIDGTCTCGDWHYYYEDLPDSLVAGETDPDLTTLHAAHVAAVIAETHAIVELPKPHRAEEDEIEDGDDPRVWRGYVTNYFVNEDQVVSDGAWIFTADGARQEAAALLAAANAAEVSS